MKKLLILSVVFVLFLAGCSQNPTTTASTTSTALHSDFDKASLLDSDVIEISEKLFIAQTNDIYLNTNDYFGKTIKYEGLFKAMYLEETDMVYNYVIRYGPGCCGYDGEAGFEIAWNGEWPEEDDWCEAIGTLGVYEEDGLQYLRLELTSLRVLEERGAEYVST